MKRKLYIKKQAIIISVILVMLLALTGCGKDGDSTPAMEHAKESTKESAAKHATKQGTAYLPSLEAYFDYKVPCESGEDDFGKYVGFSIPEDYDYYAGYIDILKSYDLEEVGESEDFVVDGNTYLYRKYRYTGSAAVGAVDDPVNDTEESYNVYVIAMLCEDPEWMYFDMYYGDGFDFVDSGERAEDWKMKEILWLLENRSEPETQEPPAAVETAVAASLPDPYYFYHEKLKHDEKQISGGWQIGYHIDYKSSAAAHAYAQLLTDSRFNLTLRDKVEGYAGNSHYYETYYVFDYNGSVDVDTISVESDSGRLEAPLIIQVQDVQYYGWCDVIVYFGDGFTFTDTGDRSDDSVYQDYCSSGTMGPVGNSGGSSNSSNASSGSSNGHWEWQTVKKDCPSCVGGTCPICHGTGTYSLYGTSTACPRSCTACNGLGYFYQQEYVYVSN